MTSDDRIREIDRQTVVSAVRLVTRDNPTMPMPGGSKESWVAVIEESLERGADARVLTHCVIAWGRQFREEADLRGATPLGMWLGTVRNQSERIKEYA